MSHVRDETLFHHRGTHNVQTYFKSLSCRSVLIKATLSNSLAGLPLAIPEKARLTVPLADPSENSRALLVVRKHLTPLSFSAA